MDLHRGGQPGSQSGRPAARRREAVAVLGEIFGNPTDLAIAEPTTDTAGQTLATFAIFDLAGLQFSPRIRDIGQLQLYRIGAGPAWRARYPHAGALLTQPIQTRLMSDHWDGLLRLVGSMKSGRTTASLLIAKLHASSRQNSLARALQEYGRLVRTIYLCRYVADEELRRRVRRQLNKGESLHALRRDRFFARQGHVRRRRLTRSIRRCASPWSPTPPCCGPRPTSATPSTRSGPMATPSPTNRQRT